MKEYIMTIAVMGILATIVDIMTPKKWEGYVKIFMGFLIISVIISPITNLRGKNFLKNQGTYKVEDTAFADKVSRELKTNVEKDIEARLLSEFGVDCDARVSIDIDENHNIKGVKKIEVAADKKVSGIEARLEEVYGCKKIEFKSR